MLHSVCVSVSNRIINFCVFQQIDYLVNGAVIIQLWGKQRMPKEKKSMTTKEFFRQRAAARMGAVGKKQTGKV